MKQPAILRKRAIRYGVGIMIILGAVYLYMNVISRTRTIDLGNFESAGYVSATMQKEDGEVAVLIDPKGTIIEAPGFVDGAADQPPIWSQDGQRLYFASDRENGESHVFRWNPAKGAVERKTVDKRTKTAISMEVPGSTEGSKTALVVSGGTVIELDPTNNTTKQVLPPKKFAVGTDGERGDPGKAPGKEGGQEEPANQFDQFYTTFGTSFKTARWSKDKAFIITVMRREEGEIMICQSQTDFTLPPTIVVAGDKIEFDISPIDGVIVYTCQKFQFPSPQMVPPELKKNGKIMYPFSHVLGIYVPGSGGMYQPGDTPQNLIALTQDDKFTFGMPTISPDGSEVMCVVGPYEGYGMMQANNLVLMPLRIGGGQQSTTLVPRRVYDASWHPNGQTIVITGEMEGKQGIFTINRDKTGMKSLTGSKGSFRGATFSPVSK